MGWRLLGETSETTYVYAYWPTVDTIAHVVGPLTAEHSAEVAGLDFQIGRLIKNLPHRGDTLLLLTADHGHVDTSPDQNVFFAEHPELLAMLRVPPAAGRRPRDLYPKPGFNSQGVDVCLARSPPAATPLLPEE